MGKAKGVVAAGHQETANAGKVILESGGNAVDAAIASAFAACVAEPLLTGLGAGGYILVHDAKTAKQVVLDFGVVMSGKNIGSSKRATSKMTPTPVDFGSTIQLFHGGHASVGVPGLVAGISEVHKRFGSMPLRELVKPAQKIAKHGVQVTKQQAYLIEILSGVIAITPTSKKLFTGKNGMLKEREYFYSPDIIHTLDEIAATGGTSFYEGDIARQIIQEMNKGGGLITPEDLASYKVVERKPVEISYRGKKLYTNPPPSSGGALIAYSLSLLSKFNLQEMGWHSAEHLTHLLGTMLVTNDIRKSHYDNNAHEEDILDRLLAEELIESGSKKVKSPLGNTTHLSIIDSGGNAVSMTSSNGSGSGVAVPGTGILLNNILGEEDLNPHGFHKHPYGFRMTSMMSPSIVTEDGQARLAIGSAGSNRIRSAVLQVASAILDFNLDVKSAINAPRIHAEGSGSTVELEAGISKDAAEQMKKGGHQVNIWKDTNLFFGGVQAVTRDIKTGELKGAGDPRRGGVAVVAN
jgi:gamma-glutamyltranspeptidase/glutathione hydrolase